MSQLQIYHATEILSHYTLAQVLTRPACQAATGKHHLALSSRLVNLLDARKYDPANYKSLVAIA